MRSIKCVDIYGDFLTSSERASACALLQTSDRESVLLILLDLLTSIALILHKLYIYITIPIREIAHTTFVCVVFIIIIVILYIILLYIRSTHTRIFLINLRVCQTHYIIIILFIRTDGSSCERYCCDIAAGTGYRRLVVDGLCEFLWYIWTKASVFPLSVVRDFRKLTHPGVRRTCTRRREEVGSTLSSLCCTIRSDVACTLDLL